MKIFNVKSESDLINYHKNQVAISNYLNNRFKTNEYSVSEIVETTESFSFRIFKNKNTETFCVYVKR